ncbi:MAG: RHS repeat-associated core domain-containing protein, partial [Oceanicoccus sp.]|uniref:RHS repeat-associated core domain-containing protein n=1 Tax=Oceanicoccus sp. TaxID=2691044 RepID=UPI00260E9685
QQGTSVNRQVFTGQEHDENTGLVYFGARYYDPDTGRFITQDSYLGEPGTPPSLHRYLYAYGNPGVYVDINGNIAWIAAGADQFSEWADSTVSTAGALTNSSASNRVMAVAAGVGAGVFKVGEGLLRTANYAGNWLSMAASTVGLNKDEWAQGHAEELMGSHKAVAIAAETMVSREGRANIGLAVYENYQQVKLGDTGAMAKWSMTFSEIGTGAMVPPVGGMATKTGVNTAKNAYQRAKQAIQKTKTAETQPINNGNRVGNVQDSVASDSPIARQSIAGKIPDVNQYFTSRTEYQALVK